MPQVILIWSENTSLSGTTSQPLEGQLAKDYQFCDQLKGVGSPSLPNYLGGSSGTTFNVQCDFSPGTSSNPAFRTTNNIFSQCEAHSMTWKTYEEALIYNNTGGALALKHNPASAYAATTNKIGNAQTPSHTPNMRMDFQGSNGFTEDIKNGTLPDFAWVTPNMINCGHSPSNIGVFDKWLGGTSSTPYTGQFPGIVALQAGLRSDGVVIIGDDSTGPTQIIYYCFVTKTKPASAPAVFHTAGTHYNVLYGIQLYLFGSSSDPKFKNPATLTNYGPYSCNNPTSGTDALDPKYTSLTQSQAAPVGSFAPAAPTNTSLPLVSDTTPVVGQVITCDGGTWAGTAPITLTGQWQTSATGTGGWSNLTLHQSTSVFANDTDTVQGGDLAQFLRCVVSASNSVGSGGPANSAATSAVGSAPSVPVNTVAPVVTGASNPPVVGDVLTTDHGSWSGSPSSFAETWQRKSAAGTITTISGATSLTYTLAAADVGFQVRSSVIATNGSGASAPAPSAWSATVVGGGSPSMPVITAPAEGAALSSGSHTVTWNASTGGTGTLDYQIDHGDGLLWRTPSSGATGLTDTFTYQDGPHTVHVRAIDSLSVTSPAATVDFTTGVTAGTILNLLVIPVERTAAGSLVGTQTDWAAGMARVKAAWEASSYSQLTLDYTFAPTVSISGTVATNDFEEIRGKALAALAATNPATHWWTYDAILYYTAPDLIQRTVSMGETFVGGGVLGPTYPTPDGRYTPQPVLHELGHVMGLAHSGAITANPFTLASFTTIENSQDTGEQYGDPYCPMGSNAAGGNDYICQVNMLQRDRLGWLATGTRRALITADGSYTLSAREAVSPTHPQALVVQGSSGLEYWIEYVTSGGSEQTDSQIPSGIRSPAGVNIRVRGFSPSTSTSPNNVRPFLLHQAGYFDTTPQYQTGQVFTDPGP